MGRISIAILITMCAVAMLSLKVEDAGLQRLFSKKS
jgi:hypothetical protein